MTRAKYLLQSRAADGIWSNPYGSGLRLTKWKTRSKHNSADEAWAARSRGGLREWRVTFRGKTVRQEVTA